MGICASGPEAEQGVEPRLAASAKARSFTKKSEESNGGAKAGDSDIDPRVKLEEVQVRVSFEFKALKDLRDVLMDPKAAKALLTFMKDEQHGDSGLGYNLVSYWLEVEDFKGIWGTYE